MKENNGLLVEVSWLKDKQKHMI